MLILLSEGASESIKVERLGLCVILPIMRNMPVHIKHVPKTALNFSCARWQASGRIPIYDSWENTQRDPQESGNREWMQAAKEAYKLDCVQWLTGVSMRIDYER